MEIVFECAKPEDIEKLIEVQNLSFREDYERYGECGSYQETEENMADMIRTAIVHKIVVDGEIVGDIIVRNRGNGTFYLRTLSVIPRFQNLGIGTKAMEFIEADHPDATVWTLITPKTSDRNRHFYEGLGFRSDGEEYRSEKLTLLRYLKELERA